jgi:thioredoxin 1
VNCVEAGNEETHIDDSAAARAAISPRGNGFAETVGPRPGARPAGACAVLELAQRQPSRRPRSAGKSRKLSVDSRYRWRTVMKFARWGGWGGLALLLAVLSAGAGAAEQPYDKTRFAAALERCTPIVVAFVADWCSTCSVQKPVVTELIEDPRFKGLTVFVADFDKELDLRKQLRVAQQSTFVAFKGCKEVGRSTGQTRKDAIAKLFAKTL